MNARAKAWGPAALWAAVVIAVSSIPRLRVPFATFSWADKLAHAGEYAVLGLLLAFGLTRDPATRNWRALLRLAAVVLAVAAFGGLDEWHQSAIPGRDMSGWDWLADVLGGALGATLGTWIRARRRAGPAAPEGGRG